jgi:DnaJ-class molecular chaperone
MEKLTNFKTYLSGCTWCNGKGYVNSPYPTTSSKIEQCPVCHGTKTIIVTEVTEVNEIDEHGIPGKSLENPQIH